MKRKKRGPLSNAAQSHNFNCFRLAGAFRTYKELLLLFPGVFSDLELETLELTTKTLRQRLDAQYTKDKESLT